MALTLWPVLAICLFLPYMSTHTLQIRNTIFGDEKLEGGVFENIDKYTELTAINDDDNPFRLPRTTVPLHYDLFWHIDISTLSFSGRVQIDIVATQPGVSQIVLHSNYTELTSVILTLKGDENKIPLTHTVEETTFHFLTIRPNIDLAYDTENPIVYTLDISFRAELRREMNGLYRSWFRNNFDDEVSWMATTHFQATGARFAFPCYDEPQLKATFKVTVRRPATHGSWFCTRRLESLQVVEGFYDDIYSETPVMPTYLLAMIVADYRSEKVLNQNDELIYEVIARPAALPAQGVYALEVGQELLKEMNNHTDYDFYSVNPNLKMTQAAIPDFSAGAMENWGLLVYREAYLMYDESHTNSNYKQLIAYILSHEIAHMWFGNLVTCHWWGMFWLNEGFARYYQYFLTHWVEDYMGFETRFIPEQVHTSLLSDSVNAHALTTNTGIGSPVEIRTMFSTISYNKGAAVIRMTEHLLGHEVHRLGLRNYLRDRSFKTAKPIDLFNELEAAAISQNAITEYGPDFSVVEYYESWTLQPGHPVLNVVVNHQTGDMIITQRRFNINTGYATNNYNYIVPISFATQSNPDFSNTKPSHILKDSVTVINRGTTGDEWVVFNKQQTGFYRVNYDDYTWSLITLALRGPDRILIHEYNRAQIVNDVFQFARSGLMTYTKAFNILSFLENETSYAPWVAAMTGFNWIRNRLVGTTTLARLDARIVAWAANVMESLGYEEPQQETFMRSYLRYQLAPFMCNMNVPVQACRDAATEQFQKLVASDDEVPPDSRNWVYCNGLRSGLASDFNYMWRRYQEHQVYNEKILLLQTLGCTTDPTSLNEFMKAIIDDNFIIRPQDYTTAWNSAVSSNEVNTQIAFDFIKGNLEDVIKAFNSAATPLSYVSSRLRKVEEINAFQNWATSVQEILGSDYNAVYNGAESSRQSIAWAAAMIPDFENYLENGDDSITTSTSTTPTPEQIVITPRPSLPEIVNPTMPDSASSHVISFTSLVFLLFAMFL